MPSLTKPAKTRSQTSGRMPNRRCACPNVFTQVVHRETRDLHTEPDCLPSFSKAKYLASKTEDDEIAVLELTAQGAGAALWMREEQREELDARRARFKSCYGMCPTRTFSRENAVST